MFRGLSESLIQGLLQGCEDRSGVLVNPKQHDLAVFQRVNVNLFVGDRTAGRPVGHPLKHDNNNLVPLCDELARFENFEIENLTHTHEESLQR